MFASLASTVPGSFQLSGFLAFLAYSAFLNPCKLLTGAISQGSNPTLSAILSHSIQKT